MGFKNNDRVLKNPNLGDDEPIFVVRAQDATALDVIGYWLRRNYSSLSEDRKEEAHALAGEFRMWQAIHADRVKRPD